MSPGCSTATGAAVPGPGRGDLLPAPTWGARTIVGDVARDSGPDGLAAALRLTESLRRAGADPPPVQDGHAPPGEPPRSVDFSQMELPGGGRGRRCPSPLRPRSPPENRAVCYLTYTNENTHAVIRANLDRSPLFSGVIEGVGPRYCPSIEDKVVRFADKPRHQLFHRAHGAGHGGSFTFRASPPPCRRMCRSRCSTPCPVWSRRR